LYYYRSRYYQKNYFISKDKIFEDLLSYSILNASFISYSLPIHKDFKVNNFIINTILDTNKEIYLIEEAINLNLYLYSYNSPIQFIDIFGYNPDCCNCEDEYLSFKCYNARILRNLFGCIFGSLGGYAKSPKGKHIIWRGKLTKTGEALIYGCILGVGSVAWWEHLNCIPGYIGCKIGCK